MSESISQCNASHLKMQVEPTPETSYMPTIPHTVDSILQIFVIA